MTNCIRKAALPFFLCLTTLFIWGQSLLSAESSTIQSETAKELLSLLPMKGSLMAFLLGNIRDVAHFCEFALLGAEWSLYWQRSPFTGWRRWLLPLAGPLTAVADELLQLTADGRAFEYSDVLLDVAGSACGFLLLLGAVWLFKRSWENAKYKKRIGE